MIHEKKKKESHFFFQFIYVTVMSYGVRIRLLGENEMKNNFGYEI